MSENSFLKEEIYELKLEKNEKDIWGIGVRTTKNEQDIVQLEKTAALSEQRFQTLLTQLSEVPATMIELKETMIAMQSETKVMMMSIQNENKNTNNEVRDLKDEVIVLKKTVKDLEDKGKFDVIKFLTGTVIPSLLTGGVVYLIK